MSAYNKIGENLLYFVSVCKFVWDINLVWIPVFIHKHLIGCFWALFSNWPMAMLYSLTGSKFVIYTIMTVVVVVDVVFIDNLCGVHNWKKNIVKFLQWNSYWNRNVLFSFWWCLMVILYDKKAWKIMRTMY